MSPPKKGMQLLLEWSKLTSQKHRGKDSGAVFLDVFLLPESRSGASFAPKACPKLYTGALL